MADAKHTPGPWSVEYKDGETRLIANGEIIMCDMTYYPWVPEDDADWHLIAAAPDLLDALNEVCEWSKRQNIALPSSKAYEAIAKAEGKS